MIARIQSSFQKSLNNVFINTENKYLDYLVKFGFTESLFEMISEDTVTIRIMKREVPKLPDLSRFKKVDHFIISDAELVDLHPSLGNLDKLELLVLCGNKIKSLPKEIGNLKNLTFMNLIGNKITDFPEKIKYLDKSNGGSLYRIAVDEKDIGAENYQKLKQINSVHPKTLIRLYEKSMYQKIYMIHCNHFIDTLTDKYNIYIPICNIEVYHILKNT